MTQEQNQFLLAAENSPALLHLLQKSPHLASAQDDHGYSLVHAASSYNHVDLLRILVLQLKVNVDLKDEDDETALFVVETVEAARVLVEELSADLFHRGSEGLTAREKIESEGEFPEVARYLASAEAKRPNDKAKRPNDIIESAAMNAIMEIIRPPPQGMKLTVGIMDQVEEGEIDPEFRRRIEELAQRPDFDTPTGQADLRKLVENAIMNHGPADERSVRPKHS